MMFNLVYRGCGNALAGFTCKRGEAFFLEEATHIYYFQNQVAFLFVFFIALGTMQAKVSYHILTIYTTIILENLCQKTGEI